VKQELSLKFVQSLTISLVKNEIFDQGIWDKITQTLTEELLQQESVLQVKYWEVCIRGLKAA